jgi:hypothetical protein
MISDEDEDACLIRADRDAFLQQRLRTRQEGIKHREGLARIAGAHLQEYKKVAPVFAC